MNLLPEVSSLVVQLSYWLPRAKAVCDDGDGLRSPSLEGSVSGGGWSDSVQERLVVALDERNDDGRPRQTAAARLARAEDDIAAARRALTCAWADAHRQTAVGLEAVGSTPGTAPPVTTDGGSTRTKEPGGPGSSPGGNPQGERGTERGVSPTGIPARAPLRLPSDHLEACSLLCSALSDLGPVDDGDGLVADRIRDTHRLLERALGAVHGVLPAPNAVKRLDTDAGIPGCLSCQTVGQYVPARKGCDRCDWCARWKAAKGTDPLREILELHHAGRRITDRAVRLAELAAKRKADEAKKRKRKVKR